MTPPRGSRRPLSRERVLRTAVDLVDARGISALTMRALASALDVEAMSLYHHLPGKDALLDGVVEIVFAEIDEAIRHAEDATGSTENGDGDDWRTVLRRQFLAARRVMLAHPWAQALLGSRRTVPAALYLYYDRILGVLVGAGFSYHLAHQALHAFGSMPLGFVQEIFNPTPAGDETEAAADPAEEDLASMADLLPHLTAMMASEIHATDDPTLGWCDSQVEFEFTLDLLLDGLERLRSANGQPSG